MYCKPSLNFLKLTTTFNKQDSSLHCEALNVNKINRKFIKTLEQRT